MTTFKVIDSFSNVISYTAFAFSGGEIQVRITDPLYETTGEYTITGNVTNSEEFMELAMLRDALRRAHPGCSVALRMPYLPYARQDRVCAPGEALGLKVFAEMLNLLNFERVEVWDAHSDVSAALINNMHHRAVEDILCPFLFTHQHIMVGGLTLVAPDAGASKKVAKVAQNVTLPMVQATKHRDVQTGAITRTSVDLEYTRGNLLMVDDICDGGRTFIELAKVLRPKTTGKIYLYVTHGIFSQGLHVFNGIIDHIYCANVWPNVGPQPILTVIGDSTNEAAGS